VSYYKKVLQPGETVLEVARLHWITYARAMLMVFIAACVLVLGLVYGDQDQQRSVLYVALVLGAIGVLLWLWTTLRRSGVEIVVTDRRVIYKRGFINRYTAEMKAARLRDGSDPRHRQQL